MTYLFSYFTIFCHLNWMCVRKTVFFSITNRVMATLINAAKSSTVHGRICACMENCARNTQQKLPAKNNNNKQASKSEWMERFCQLSEAIKKIVNKKSSSDGTSCVLCVCWLKMKLLFRKLMHRNGWWLTNWNQSPPLRRWLLKLCVRNNIRFAQRLVVCLVVDTFRVVAFSHSYFVFFSLFICHHIICLLFWLFLSRAMTIHSHTVILHTVIQNLQSGMFFSQFRIYLFSESY